ncbi:Cytochrome P450 [Neofusicoccum parvum]|nr:Cytochrome P450 [Neofusicoccum parvum]
MQERCSYMSHKRQHGQRRSWEAIGSRLIPFLFLALIARAICNIYFHPLSKYPGPKYAAITDLVYQMVSIWGIVPTWTADQHKKYGEVVRLGPGRLSYTHPQAWKEIYGHRVGTRKPGVKDKKFAAYQEEYNGEDTIISTLDDGEHSAIRKIFSHAFSDRALKEQESLIRKYTDVLIDNVSQAPGEIDMVKLYNCTTFDIMGDLSFGESLGLLTRSEYSPWVKAVFGNIKAGSLLTLGYQYPFLLSIIKPLVPRSLREQARLHFEHSAERVDRRMEKGSDKPDIWNLVLEKEQGKLTLPQMHANASIFMIAGTETTATLLSGLTYLLLTNPAKMAKAVEEVRGLECKDDLNLETLPRLKYLSACFEEALRCYPPAVVGSPRQVAKGGSEICGNWVPENTQVNVPQYATFHSALNFKDPDSFIPERWLPGTGYDSDRKEGLQPFSTGPRNCIGKNLAYHEMRMIMAQMLWNFDLELCPQSAEWTDQKCWTLWEKPPLWVKAKFIR